ncbi:ankyrin, partial [Pseudovirgaria hyperparasitica]
MSWSSSAQFKEDTRRSPTEATSSPRPRNAFSPSVASGRRDRSNSIPESRKRKARDEGHIRNLEPPRQRHKTDGAVRELSNPRQQQPQSSLSSTTAASRQHRRSASTQSAVQGSSSTQGRKRRDASNLIISTHDHRAWSSHSSSDEDSSPRRPSQPKLQHMRLKRSSHRSLTSPARTMPKKDTDKFGATKLAREAERGDLKSVIAAYNEKNDDLNRPDFAGFTPLQKAALNGYDDVVKFLIDKGCDTSCQSGDRDTPLIDAAENGHIEVVRLLLRQGKVNPHHQNKKGQRAIDVLKDGSDFEELEKELKEAMLREADTSANKEEDKANLPSKQASSLLYNEYNVETMKDKAAEGNVQLVGELLESRVKPNIACGIAAARGGHDDILSLFLAEGLKADPDPAKHSETYMTVAIGRGHLRVIELLLNQENFDPTRENREGLNYWQLAEQRRGPKWEQERSLLKERYDAYLNKRSPNRSRKHAPASSNSPPPARTKLARRSSPQPTDRSLSP